MKIMDTFGVGGSFTEYYAMDFNDDVVLMGHDGPGPYKNRRRKDPSTATESLSLWLKVGRGFDTVEMSVKHGPVTLLFPWCKPSKGKLKIVGGGRRIGSRSRFLENREYQ